MAGRGLFVKRGLLSDSAKVALFLALLLFSVHASASCVELGYQACIDVYSEASTEKCFSGSTLPNCGVTTDGTCFTSGSLDGICLCSSFPSGNGCPSVMPYWGSGLSGGGYYTGNVAGISQCRASYGCAPTRRSCDYTVKCSTQAEADSVANSHAGRDTTIFVCNESMEYDYTTGRESQPYMQLYRCDCKWNTQTNTGTCNGKTQIDPRTDCELVMNVPGTCNDNGYQQGPNTDTTGSSATCYAVIGDNCYMRDNRTGNTFSCPCDGNCNYAYEQIIQGFCSNPYTSSASQDSTIDVFGSSSSMGGSSASQGGEDSSASGDSTDFEYDYTSILEAIRANTQGTMNNTQNIDANFAQTNISINNVTNAVNNVTNAVNNASSNIGNKLNTLITDFGEYSTMWANSDGGVVVDTSGDYPFDTSYVDSSLDSVWNRVLRTKAESDSILDVMGDTTTKYIVFDSIYDWSDSAKIKSTFSDFFFNTPASNSCPVFDFTMQDLPVMGTLRMYIDFGDLFGKFDLCLFIRGLVRLATLIVIVFGTIKAVRTAFSNGG